MELKVGHNLQIDKIEAELDDMVEAVSNLDPGMPDEIIMVCMAYMARCTEMHLQIIRVEGKDRKLKWLRTAQLQKLMDLLDFTYKAASRLTELRRQDIELSK